MQIVISDTGPVNYLLLIGHIDILPALFEKVILPSAVRDELTDTNTPAAVRNWVGDLPAWVEVHNIARPFPKSTEDLGAGETAAIALAADLHADLLLMDDRRGAIAARKRGLTVTGTMGLLARAANRELVDLGDAFRRLKQTNFRFSQDIMDALLSEASREV